MSPYTRYEHDLAGNVVKQWEFFGEFGTSQVEHADTFVYDTRNRLATTIRKDGTRVDSIFNEVGQLTASVDPLGNTTYSILDARGRVIEQRLADPDGSGSQVAPVTANEYDAAGNIESTTDALGNTTSFEYDSLGRLRKESRDETLIADDTNVAGDLAFKVTAGPGYEAAYYQTDNAQYSSYYYDGDTTWWWMSAGVPQATWTFDALNAGTYRVAMTWRADAVANQLFDSNAQVQIIVDGAVVQAAFVDQRKSGNIPATHGERTLYWTELASAVNVPAVADGAKVEVRLMGHAGVPLLADAVRIDRVVSSSYDYDKNGNLTKSTDTRGNVTDYQFDELNRQTKVTLPDPDALTGNDDGPGNTNLGRFETQTFYDGYGNRILTLENRGTSATSDDRVNLYYYDQRNRLTQQVIEAGTGIHENITTSYTYDSAGNTLTITDPVSSVTRYRYDALDRVIDEYQDYGDGSDTAQPLQLGNPSVTGGVSFANSNTSITLTGDVQTWVSLTGATSSYRVTHQTVLEFDLATVNPALFRVIGFDTDSLFTLAEKNHYFDLGGDQSYPVFFTTDFRQATAPNGKIQIPIGQYLTDSEKVSGLDITRLFFWNFTVGSVLAPDFAKSTFSNIKLFESDEVRTVTTYDPRGNVSSVQTKSDPRNIVTRFEYDLLDRQTAKILDAGGPQQRRYTTIYDAAGNVLVERNPSGATGSASAATVDTVYQYDNLHRLTKTTLPDPDGLPGATGYASEVTTFAYDAAGNLIAETNGENETTRTYYDAQGRAISELDGNDDETRYRYDSEGNLTFVIDAEQNVTKYTYDGMNRQKTETITAAANGTVQPLTRTNIYDNAGNLFQAIDRNGRVREFAYDTLDRRTIEFWKNSPGGSPVNALTWQYDDLSRVTKETDGGAINTFAYDGLGRLTEQTNYDPIVSGGGTSQPQVRQTYDYGFEYESGSFHDNVIRDQYLHSGSSDIGVAKSVSTYDRLGRLQFIDDSDNSSSSSSPQVDDKSLTFSYDAAGNLSQIDRDHLNSGFSSSFVHDKAKRQTSITHDVATDIVHSYAYDNASRVTSFNTTPDFYNLFTRNYTYDDAGQLTSRTGGTGESYTYDDNGNRVSVGSQSVATSLSNRLTDDGTYTYEYDKEGNVTKRTVKSNTALTTEYTWDHRNRLTAVTEKNGTTITSLINYVYDAQDRRVKRAYDANGGAPSFVNEYFVYDGDELAMRFGNAQELTHRYLYGPAVDQVLADEVFAAGTGGQRVSDKVLWQLADQQGTVRDIVDDYGNLKKHIDYDSFGEVINENAYNSIGQQISPTSAEAIDQLFFYTGQERDNATLLYNYNARWYDPRTGRFLSEDPIDADANTYRYAGNDPVNYTDPMGLFQAGNPLSALKYAASKVASAVQTIGNAVNSAYNTAQYYASANQTKAAVGGFQVAGLNSDAYRYVQNSGNNTGLLSGISASRGSGSGGNYGYAQPGFIGTASRPAVGLTQLGISSGPFGDTPPMMLDGSSLTDRQVVSTTKIESTVFGAPFTKAANDALPYTKSANPFVSIGATLTYGLNKLTANFIDTLLPASDPTYVENYADGGKRIILGGGPHSGAMWGQGLMVVAPISRALGGVGVAPAPSSVAKNPYNISTQGMTAAERQATIEYAQRTNAWLQQNGPVTVQSTQGTLRSQASAAARTERLEAARAGQPYQGQAGHVPDTALTGQAQPPGGWLDMPGTSNNVVGGGLGSRVGKTVDVITIDGKRP